MANVSDKKVITSKVDIILLKVSTTRQTINEEACELKCFQRQLVHCNSKAVVSFCNRDLHFWACGYCIGKYIFSNSLIIHQEKTKKITTVTVVWICVPNYHKILPTLALNFSKNY